MSFDDKAFTCLQLPLVAIKNESLESHDHDHRHIERIPTVTVALLAGICSFLFG